jgi:Ser/Thr protein kinase RdoA (MazF antagonist)
MDANSAAGGRHPDELSQAVRQHYGLVVSAPRFLSRGWGGDCYVAETRAGERYFLKLHDPTDILEMAASSRAFYLPLIHQLYTRGILRRIPHPLPTLKGDYSIRIAEVELVITNFIPGEVIGFGTLPESVLSELARRVGILHGCLDQLAFEHPFVERFEIIPEDELLVMFSEAASIPPEDSPGRSGLREMLLPEKRAVLTALERLQALQGYAEASDRVKVICHTDLHGANLILDDLGELYILDWENAMIAPPEHDMIFFAGEPNFWETFWPNYSRKFPHASLDLEMLRFYFHRRAFEDILGLAQRILQGEGSQERDLSDLGYLRDNLEGLGSIETTLSKLQREAAHRGGDHSILV